LVGDFERERCREIERAICGRTALLTYRGSFAGSLLHGTSTLAAALQVFWCFTATLTDRYRVRSAPLASRSGTRHRAFLLYRHPASVPCASFSASCRKRRSAHDARSPLGRSGAVCVRRKASSRRLPFARSLRPGERGVGIDGCASCLPCRVRRVASCHRASSCGDIHVAACSVIIPGWRHRAENCDDILSSLRSPRFTTEITDGRHPAEESSGHRARQRKRPPRGGLVERRFTPVQMLVQSLSSIAVGTAVASRPPHRSVLEELPHTAPALSRAAKRWFGYG